MSVINEIKKELARRELWEYCKLRHPEFYKPEREYLKEMADEIQEFIEQDEDKFLVINLPPRHGKSFTSKNTVEWLLGKNNKLRIMTGSYNERLSSSFAKQVRDTVSEIKASEKITYNEIFPETKIKYGEASASLWALEGSQQKNYLATSPNGTATGFGADIIIVDDLIKKAEEAYNEESLEKHWGWFTNTMMQRTEGNWKVIIIMTRWASRDLAGMVLANYDNVKLISYSAYDGKEMLCDDVLNKKDYDLKIKNMNPDIAEANYNQKPIDAKGKLYSSFKEYETLPKTNKIYNYTDTADTGDDYLCSIVYTIHNGDAYVLDILFTDDSMETTEQETSNMFVKNNVHISYIESNNGGRGFARNVTRINKEKGWTRTVIKPFTQSKNKKSRILTSSSWCTEHIIFPINWKQRWPEFYKHINRYQKKGKNKHDDGPDVLAGIYDKHSVKPGVQFGNTRIM